ncbi:TetR family transcriptional regulator [Rubrobacter tropicus]|uniref:TetR family transcriptional regulator n=1 Tax=Rubrobacter tropicus TaxID=2653851 RepID=A0A6G8QEE2_9ACTN|nr:TetR/AcrR family transcriptional regulator [Rubrobacter tropicus]QIN84860.1 TetR family transcriptional regulator [Rubrobacter tropicus]
MGRGDAERGILESAARLLVVDRGASMERIAGAAGVGRTTLHRHFRNREALIRAIALDAIEECEAAIEKAGLEEGSVREATGRLFEALIPVGERYHFLLAEAQLEKDPEIVAAEGRIDAPMRGLIERGKADGTFAAGVPDAWVLSAMEALTFAAWEGVRDGYLAPRDTPGLVTETLLCGLGGRKGGPG